MRTIAGLNFFIGGYSMDYIIKPATTFDAQILLLEERGLLIHDKKIAREVLSRMNYYTISGYLHGFKTEKDTYIVGLTFEKINRIIEFDRRFRSILMYGVETIEHTLKTKISYSSAHNHGPMGYLNGNNFKDHKQHEIFLSKFNRAKINNRNLPFIKHHTNRYGGELPIWVATDIFTMGMLFHFYGNMETKLQKGIAKEFNTGPNQLISWMDNITYIRNLIAHYMRLYNFKLQKTPVKCNNNHGDYNETTYKIFDVVYIMMFLIQDANEWNNYIIANIKALFLEYDHSIDIDDLGFPDNWESILKKNS